MIQQNNDVKNEVASRRSSKNTIFINGEWFYVNCSPFTYYIITGGGAIIYDLYFIVILVTALTQICPEFITSKYKIVPALKAPNTMPAATHATGTVTN